jgi:hypothetical protein
MWHFHNFHWLLFAYDISRIIFLLKYFDKFVNSFFFPVPCNTVFGSPYTLVSTVMWVVLHETVIIKYI